MTPDSSQPPAQPSKPSKALAVGCTIAFLAALLVFREGGSGDDPDAGPEIRPLAPELSVLLLSGETFDLAAHRGETVILDFWATWCAPCEVQMPVLDTLWKTRDGRGLQIVGVSVDTDPAHRIEAWIKERDIEYPIALGDQDLANRFGAIGFPTLIVIDPDGGIHTRHLGVLSRPELEEILDEIDHESRPPR